MLDQPSGSPDAYQVQQAIQQQAKREEVDAGMTKSQRINMVMDAVRAGRSIKQRLKTRRRAMMDYAAAKFKKWLLLGKQKWLLLRQEQAKKLLDVFTAANR